MPLSTDFIAASTVYATYDRHVSAPAFRRSFVLPSMRSAVLTICGLGFYELFLNGKRLTRGHLSPYIANADHFLYYDHYDLLSHVREGENVLGILLGNGLQNCFGGAIWALDELPSRSAPKLALSFEGETIEGEEITFNARDGFLCAESGILMNDLRAGEWYDARVLPDNWCTADYDAQLWRTPIAAKTPLGTPRLADIEPILATRELSAVSIRKGGIGRFSNIDKSLPLYPIPEDEVSGYIYDFGVNAAGVCRLHITDARPGQRLTLVFGEKLTPEGDLDLWSMFYAPQAYSQRDVYICRGGDETYTPSFTYHGFRYCMVTGLREEQAIPSLLTYVVMNTRLDRRAHFACSDPIANRLWDAATVSDLANFWHFPTDCPQREKNGWTGDASLSVEQMMIAFSPERNLREWLHNIRAAMREDGTLPGIVPTGNWGYGHGPAWDNVIVNLPYFIWLYRGDVDVLRENADAIERYLHYIETRMNEQGLCDYGLGDWCPAGQTIVRTPTVVTSTLTCLDYCRKAEIIFSALNMHERATHAAHTGDRLRAAAHAHLMDAETLTVRGGTQTAQAMGLYYGLFADAERPAAYTRLLCLIEDAGGTFDCGILGMRVLFHVLSAGGDAELAYRLITQDKFPSYGYMIANGATSLWETFHRIEDCSPSLNHHFFGDIVSWLMQNVVGIHVNPHRQNPNELWISPASIASISHAEGSYEAPAGRVELAWVRREGRMCLSYRVPEGIQATLCPWSVWQTETGPCSPMLVGEGSMWLARRDRAGTD